MKQPFFVIFCREKLGRNLRFSKRMFNISVEECNIKCESLHYRFSFLVAVFFALSVSQGSEKTNKLQVFLTATFPVILTIRKSKRVRLVLNFPIPIFFTNKKLLTKGFSTKLINGPFFPSKSFVFRRKKNRRLFPCFFPEINWQQNFSKHLQKKLKVLDLFKTLILNVNS